MTQIQWSSENFYYTNCCSMCVLCVCMYTHTHPPLFETRAASDSVGTWTQSLAAVKRNLILLSN